MAFSVRKGSAQVDFEELLDATFLEYLRELVSMGALVSVGASKDRGACSVTVTVGGEWDREWFRDNEDLIDWCKEAVVAVQAMEPSASQPSRRRRGA